MKFVMTGHKGLIGSSLLRRLEDQGSQPVLLIDRRAGSNVLDLKDRSLEESTDMFIHLASFCKINQIIANPQTAFDDNVLGMHTVMEFCRRNEIPKVVFTSSSRVLSREKNPYTASKIYGEELVKGYFDSYGIEYVIVRPSTVYGPFNDLTRRLIDIFILNALRDEELVIFGDRDKTLDFTYIDDFLDGFELAMAQRNEDYDISGGKGVNLEDVADMVIGLAGQGRKVFREPEVAQPQDVEVDISKLSALGYRPKISIEEGVRRTFEWYKGHLGEIENIRK